MRTDPFVADAFAADLRRLDLDEVHFALPATLAGEVGLPISYLADSVAVRPAAAEDLAFALLP
jgi:hypothetical protein